MRKFLLLATVCLSLLAFWGCKKTIVVIDEPERPIGEAPIFNVTDTIIPAIGGKVVFRQTNNVNWSCYSVSTNPIDAMAEYYMKEYPPIGLKGYVNVIGSWFVYKKIDERTIEITIARNNTGQERTVGLTLFNSDYSNLGGVMVTQSN